MYTFYQVNITKTARPMGAPTPYESYDRQTLKFDTLEAVKEFLKETYPECKRQKIYHTTQDGDEAIGWVYCYKEEQYQGWSQPEKMFYCQDWVDVEKMDVSRVFIDERKK